MHYVDEGPPDGPVVVLAHDEPTWGYLYRTMIPGWWQSADVSLQSIGRLVLSAALLMCVPLTAIGMSGVLTMKLFGVGMVFAVLVDVLVVRILLGSAVMKLMGRAAWWAPGPLARFYMRYGVKETDVPTDADKPIPVAG
ncbi:hypothetical protein GCM10027074_54820 [Streptomyces deserti]